MEEDVYLQAAKELLQTQLFSGHTERSAIGWSLEDLVMWLRCDCTCAYCERELLDSFITMQFDAQRDHLLPRVVYKELENEESNFVLACSACNKVKGAWDANASDPVYVKGSGTPLSQEQREELIRRVREINSSYEEPTKSTFDRQKKILKETCERLRQRRAIGAGS